MTFRKTACLAAMLMCCSQTAFAAEGYTWDEHLNAKKSADEKTVTSSGFSETFRAGGTQKAEKYADIYIGHVADERDRISASGTLSAVASNNKGVMGSGLEAGIVYGGYFESFTYSDKAACDFEVKDNEIVLESGSKVAEAAGGAAYTGGCKITGVVSGNSVKALEGAGADIIKGGYADGGISATFSVLNNTVSVAGGNVNVIWGGYARASKAYACKNTVIVNNVVAEDGFTDGNTNSIIGGCCDLGYGFYGVEEERIASENTVIINNSKVSGRIWGGVVLGSGSSSEAAKDTVAASGNTVTLTDTEFYGTELAGGYAVIYDSGESGSISATANDNTLVLNGGSYSSDNGIAIFGGYAVCPEAGTYKSEASNNRIELRNGSKGAPVFSENTLIIGGCDRSTGSKSTSGTGNSLNFYDVKGMKAGNIGYFQILNYDYQKMRAGDVIFELTGSAFEIYDAGSAGNIHSVHYKIVSDAKQPTSIANAKVSVRVANLIGSDGGDFKAGDKVVLFKNANGVDVEGVTLSLTAPKGATVSYEAAIETSEDKTEILLRGKGMKVNPGTKSIAEGTGSGIALAGEAAGATIDLLRDISFVSGAVTPFVHVQGSSIRHETGSSVNVSTVSLVAGLGYAFETGAGSLGVGAYFEYGKGSYTTSNSLPSGSDMNGDGSSWYMGGGILAKMEFLQTGPGHFYLEGSAHMGSLHNEYDSELTDFYGNAAGFDMDSPYYSLHGGLGYVWNMAEGHDLDVYGKYIWTRVQGTDVTLTTKDKYEFDNLDSNRLRFGVRYTYNGSQRFSPYVGAAWEHEFSGSCDSKVYGHSVAAPSFEGSSGIGELGIKMNASEEFPLSINLGVQGYVGQKQGISGNCVMMYEF